jgi:hypothetical protein
MSLCRVSWHHKNSYQIASENVESDGGGDEESIKHDGGGAAGRAGTSIIKLSFQYQNDSNQIGWLPGNSASRPGDCTITLITAVIYGIL